MIFAVKRNGLGAAASVLWARGVGQGSLGLARLAASGLGA